MQLIQNDIQHVVSDTYKRRIIPVEKSGTKTTAGRLEGREQQQQS